MPAAFIIYNIDERDEISLSPRRDFMTGAEIFIYIIYFILARLRDDGRIAAYFAPRPRATPRS